MKKSKAISLLKGFSNRELKEFGLFLRSPFFTSEKIHFKLYNILKKYHPLFPESKIGKKRVHSIIYPGNKYHEGTMRNIISDFLKLEMEYLRIKGMREDICYNEHFLMNELMKRNEPVLFNKIKRKNEEIMGRNYKNSAYFLNKFLQDEMSENLLVKTHDRFLYPQFEKSLLENFLSYSILQILYLNSKILNSNKLAKVKFNKTIFEEEITGFLEGDGRIFIESTYIKCYYLMYKLLKTANKRYFFELKNYLFSSYRNIENAVLRTLFTAIENYAVDKINSGVLEFYKELFHIYRFMVEHKFYSGSFGHMRHIFYLNIVSIGLEAGEMDWVERFINDYKDEVYEELRENSYNMAYAIICYWKKDYDKAIAHVSKVSTEDFAFKINIRSLYLKIYYDLNEAESFYSHIEALKHYCTKSKDVPKNIRPLLADYVNFSKRLFDIKNGTGTEVYDLLKLKKEITEIRVLMNKTWLLKKIHELENK